MKIAFDLDGVLCDIDVSMLNIIYKLKQIKKETELWYYRERKPLLNPYMFLTEDDEFIIVTARKKHLYDVTKRWLGKFLPGVKWFLVDEGYTTPEAIAQKKLSILQDEKVDVYIDDNQGVIKMLRSMNTDIKFIQYGGRI